VDCHLNGWDPIASAGYLSQLAGVLAGLVFAGVVVLLSDRSERTGRVRAAMLLTSGLLAMVVASTLFAIIAGTAPCALAMAMTAPTVGLLTIGILAILGGIASLIDTYDTDGRAVRVTNLGTYVVAWMVVVLAAEVPQALTGGLLNAGLIDFKRTWLSPLYGNWALISTGLVLITLVVRPLIHRSATGRDRTDQLAIVAARVCIAYVAVAGAVVAYVVLFTKVTDWQPTSSGHIAVSGDAIRNLGYIIEIFSTAAMVVQVLALPLARRPALTGIPSDDRQLEGAAG
jgi:hypothetical protein